MGVWVPPPAAGIEGGKKAEGNRRALPGPSGCPTLAPCTMTLAGSLQMYYGPIAQGSSHPPPQPSPPSLTSCNRSRLLLNDPGVLGVRPQPTHPGSEVPPPPPPSGRGFFGGSQNKVAKKIVLKHCSGPNLTRAEGEGGSHLREGLPGSGKGPVPSGPGQGPRRGRRRGPGNVPWYPHPLSPRGEVGLDEWAFEKMVSLIRPGGQTIIPYPPLRRRPGRGLGLHGEGDADDEDRDVLPARHERRHGGGHGPHRGDGGG